ncbi:multidrug resistance-associated protein 5 isoform X8 [Nannospalax galili]|uniref:multidrug resistance-associated protein 5 isoform X8 n=2 Tax=Nannospalax galili TaxID=1026970 RepID=UPI00111C58EE|nr:multidrug resistance-associated protein 5 isoform X8 [Nannospalax galili]XP_029418482.1 multidrug resistance-associated protein 5 isoform X8 [Nannospalax galili]XP_029418483.1 multidrug resistance-associated protein 5 isoform X8 [Nannospalax galili]
MLVSVPECPALLCGSWGAGGRLESDGRRNERGSLRRFRRKKRIDFSGVSGVSERNSEVKRRVCEPWHLYLVKMKDIDMGKEYIIPSPGYRNVRERGSTSAQHRDHEESRFQRTRALECQDALETAARAEGLALDVSVHSHLRILDEEHPKGKYHHGLRALKPFRTTSKHQHPVDNAGLFSCMTFSWLSPLARVVHKKGELLMEDVWSLSKYESSDVNCRRLERLWQEELNEVGPDAASLRRVVWIFCRTRLILSIVCLMITQLAGFSGPNFQDGCILRSE